MMALINNIVLLSLMGFCFLGQLHSWHYENGEYSEEFPEEYERRDPSPYQEHEREERRERVPMDYAKMVRDMERRRNYRNNPYYKIQERDTRRFEETPYKRERPSHKRRFRDMLVRRARTRYRNDPAGFMRYIEYVTRSVGVDIDVIEVPKCVDDHRLCEEVAGFTPDMCNNEVAKKKCSCLCAKVRMGKKYLQCGQKNDKLSDSRIYKRVIGGRPSTSGQWPWVVSVNAVRVINQTTKELAKKSTLWCGGTILSKRFILTTKNGFDKDYVSLNPKHWSISAGHLLINKKENGEQDIGVKRIILKTQVNDYVFRNTSEKPLGFVYLLNDIALLELEEPLKFSDKVSPLCLIGEKDRQLTDNCYIAGWGYTKYDEGLQGVPSNNLQSVRMPVVSNSQCNEKAAYDNTIPPTILCAGYKEGGKDGCNFDSGAALACKGDKYWYENGLLSTGYKCAQPNAYGLYTPVKPYRDWIIETILK